MAANDLTQEAVEVLLLNNPNVDLTQIVVEVISPNFCTLTGHIVDAGNVSLVDGLTFVRLRLRNLNGKIPRGLMAGSLFNTVLVETQLDIFPDANGNISQPIWEIGRAHV